MRLDEALRCSKERRTSLVLLVTLTATALLVRLPSILWPFTFNWDENTFFTVAQQTLEGNLPYTTTLENKSPLALIPHSLAFLVVGGDPHGLRAAAAVVIGLTAFMLVRLTPGFKRPLLAYLLGAVYILLWATLPLGLAWMSEVNVAFLFALALTLSRFPGHRSALLLWITGLFVGAIPLARINWSFVAVGMFLVVVARVRSVRRTLVFLAGCLSPLIFVVLTYALTGNLPNLWLGMIELPRQLSAVESIRIPTLADSQLPALWLAAVALVTALILMSLQLARLKRESISPISVLTLVGIWALTFGAWIQPYDWPHQTLQTLPFLLLAAGEFIRTTHVDTSVGVVPLTITAAALTYFYSSEVLVQYDWREQARIEHAVSARVGAIVDLDQQSIWVPDQTNYIYWRTGKPPLLAEAALPGLLWDPGAQAAFFGKTLQPDEATARALDLEPDLIVARTDFTPPAGQGQQAPGEWDTKLAASYELLDEVDGVSIWQRIE